MDNLDTLTALFRDARFEMVGLRVLAAMHDGKPLPPQQAVIDPLPLVDRWRFGPTFTWAWNRKTPCAPAMGGGMQPGEEE